MPHVDVDVWDGLTSVHINHLSIKVDWDALFALGQVLTNQFAVNDFKADIMR